MFLSQPSRLLPFRGGLGAGRGPVLVSRRRRLGRPDRARGADRRRGGDRLGLRLRLPLLCRLRAVLDALQPAQVVALVGGGLRADRLRHLVPGPARRDDQPVVRHLLRHDPEGAGQAGRGDGGGVLRAARHLPDHRDGLHHHRRPQRVLHQPFRVPLADRDERPLCRAVAAGAAHRRRLAAGAGRHHALRRDRGIARRQVDRRGDDADRLPADPLGAVGPHQGNPGGRRDRLCAGVGRHTVVGVRDRDPGARRLPPAGARVPQPAGRGRVPGRSSSSARTARTGRSRRR